MLNVHNASQGRWVEILTRLGANASSLEGKHRPCPSCAGTDRFRFDDQEGRGSHICSQCGAGDGFELVQKMYSCDFKEAAIMVEEVLGIKGKAPSKEEKQAYRKRLADE
ncbi:MAG: primase-helicase zinc-binding domain-containing protein, partial [Mariprofundaceae bacterium]|nr:primase-helicase zinc-binding domain-containing protein [Mariprofundaceae bacterium]